MKQRIAVGRAEKDGLALSIMQFVERPRANGLHVVPTTASTLSVASSWTLAKDTYVVGDQKFLDEYGLKFGSRLHTPTQFLETCSRAHGTGKTISAVVFTDQMVSAEFAPILVSRRDVLQFFPSLEIIAASGYGLPVHCWCGGSRWTSPVTTNQDRAPVIRAVGRYFDACQQLGVAWLMRDRQAKRQPADRIGNARRRLRLYQSIVMASSVDGSVSEAALSTFRRLVTTRSALPDLPRS